MKAQGFRFVLISALASLASGCIISTVHTTPAGKNGWLEGSTQDQINTIAKHLRGNDIVMIEVDWRLSELAKTGLDENWANATYQIKKMHLAMELGMERRPKREASYNWFFSTALPPMEAVIEKQDKQQFVELFPTFVEQCNTCHVMEQVAHFVVEVPGSLN